MGRHILQQRAGRGNFPYRVPGHKRMGPVQYLPLGLVPLDKTISGKIVELCHEGGGRGCPLAKVRWEDTPGISKKELYLPAEGLFVGDTLELGPKAEVKIGNIKTLEQIPDGSIVFNLEGKPGDGGRFARASGLSATILEHADRGVVVELPSGKKHVLHPTCRATIGVVAGGGRTEKPFVKAGNHYYYVRAKGRKWPRSRGVVMNCNSHPYGGGAHCGVHMPKTVSRNAPPGRKVGLIAARRTGLRKK